MGWGNYPELKWAAPSDIDPDAMPRALRGLTGHLSVVPENSDYGPCIYFLIRDGEIAYVGQSEAVLARIHSHRAEKSFDVAMCLRVINRNPSWVRRAERALINCLQPPLNGDRMAPEGQDLEIAERILGLQLRMDEYRGQRMVSLVQ